MRLETPTWWYRDKGAVASTLAPLGALYGRIAEARASRVTPYRSRLPVICIGNVTAGGGGKTPTAIAGMSGALPRTLAALEPYLPPKTTLQHAS